MVHPRMTGLQRSMQPRPRVPRWLWILGPGLMVMLADTDAGSVITASQSGARWGYSLLALELALGVLGAALVASIVVSLAAAWAVAEVAGRPRSLNDGLRRAPLFYGLYAGAVALGAVLVLVSHSLVRLAIDVEVVNALLLPLVLGMLIVLAHLVLPAPHALRRVRRVAVSFATIVVALVGIIWLGFAFGL